MSLHRYAPKNLHEFMEILKSLDIEIGKARCSHTVHAVIPANFIEVMQENAKALELDFSTGRFYRASKKCQIVVKSMD
jgi:hypothetical protein